ncbi:MAG: ribulose-phosphate 3-epimerase [Candidatus Saccharimonadales bacterium]
MSVIVPAVLAETAELYKTQVEKVQPFTQRLHIDISDGEFAPTFTVSAQELWWPEGVKADIHAMVQRPEEYLASLIQLKPHMVILHAEAEGDIAAAMNTLKQYNIKAGLALLRPTVPVEVSDLIHLADHVMIFTGELGKYGGTASLMQLEKVRLVKRINSAAEIGWDGGVNVDNAYTLTQGGVNVLNTGGFIQRAADPAQAYKQLSFEINKHGVL